MPDFDISVIIVNYNVKDFLFQCLKSIERAEKNLKVEVIVVDNNSSDGSVEFLEPVFTNVRFIRLDENIGFGRANNIGISNAKGRYILILNPDTILEEQTLQVMMKYMADHPEVGISGCKVLNSDGTFQLACRRGFPTPWASFCKLFGLQKLFPKSPLFARYNQTFKDIDESYYVDSVIGAFMFARKDIINEVGGFDPEFFMYGEDLDLCFRVHKIGYKIAYVHTTSIIHYKGESTRRSSINEVKHFYQAMRIFASKHYAYSIVFLLFLRIGIFMRSIFAYANKYKKPILITFIDLTAINLSLLLGTKIRFERFFGFPDYAYPIVFIATSLILIISMIGAGEYYDDKPSIRRAFTGFMITFFLLSSLTYFFNNFAFSRGVVLMTIGFTIIISTLARFIIKLVETSRKSTERRIALIGLNKQAEKIIEKLESVETGNANVIGVITVDSYIPELSKKTNIIGHIAYLTKTIEENNIQEIIITDSTLAGNDIIKLISSNPSVKFHIAQEYEEILTSRIVNEIAGFEPTLPKTNITMFRYKLTKRVIDIVFSIFLLTIGLPVVYLLSPKRRKTISELWKVLKGEYSLIGLYQINESYNGLGKQGLIGLAHVGNPKNLSDSAINKLNEYYLQHYSMSLDIDIFIKFLTRKSNGN